MNNIKTKPFYLSNELALSNNVSIYIILINNEAFSYVNKEQEANEFCDVLSKNLLTELIQNHNSKSYTFQLIKNTETPNEFKVYKQTIGYIYNSKPELVYHVKIQQLFFGLKV
jgi:hypothetical protein